MKEKPRNQRRKCRISIRNKHNLLDDKHRHRNPTFCGLYSIDTQDRSSYTSPVKKQCLLDSIKLNMRGKYMNISSIASPILDTGSDEAKQRIRFFCGGI